MPDPGKNDHPDWSKFSSQFEVPGFAAGQDGTPEPNVDAAFEKLRPVVIESPYWIAKIALPAKGTAIPVTLIAEFYDGTNHRAPDPLRGLADPRFLCWLLAGFFQVGGELVKWTGSSNLLGVANRDGHQFLYLWFSGTEALAPYLEFLALPVPREKAPGRILLPGDDSWKVLPRFSWAPISQAEYRRTMETLQHDSHY